MIFKPKHTAGCLFVLLLLTPFHLHASIYKWVDDKGNVHYSDEEPENVQYADVQEELEKTGNFLNRKLVIYKRPKQVVKKKKDNTKSDLTIHFKTVGYSLSRADKDYLSKIIHVIYNKQEDFFHWIEADAMEITIVVTSDKRFYEKSWKEAKGRWKSPNGFYSHINNTAYVFAQPTKERTFSVILHEASHAILDTRVGWIPKWINEGMAEYFEDVVIKDSELYINLSPSRMRKLGRMSEDQYLDRLSKFLAIDNSIWYTTRNSDTVWGFYSMSWSLVYFLMSSREGQILLFELIEASKRNYGQIDSKAIIEQNYRGGYRKFKRDWLKMVNGLLDSYQ